MAIGRLSMKVGKAGKAGPHAAYIAREGQYANRLERGERLEATEAGKRLAQKRIEAEREAVPKDFKLMAQKREMKASGWSDRGEQWKAAPEPLRKLIEGYNATPKAQREAVLEQMMKNPKTREHVRELLAEQRQQYRANDRGISL